MKNFDQIIIVAWLCFGLYLTVLLLVIADLWSGVRKAGQRGEVRTSYGYRKTITKLCRYYNAMMALTFIDCMQIGSIWYLNNYYTYNIPIFPFVTLIGAIGIGIIEVKSIFEKADEKARMEYKRLGDLATELAGKISDPKEIAQAIITYMNNQNDTTHENRNKTNSI